MHVGSQLGSLLLSAIGFSLALSSSDAPKRRALLRQPVFWTGIGLLVYATTQGLNPAWRFFDDGKVWWLEPVQHVAWLPAGVDAPFARTNAWRFLVVYASLFLLLCSVHLGLRQRSGLRILLWALAINGSVLALFGIFQRLDATDRMFWIWRPPSLSFFASFIYQNHAGAYLNLVIAATAGLAWWYQRRATRETTDAGLAGILIFLAVLAGIGSCLTTSRMSTLVLLVMLAIFGTIMAAGRKKTHRAMFPLMFALGLALGLGVLLVAMNRERLLERFSQLASNPDGTLRSRTLVHRATWELAQDRWLCGWGAGSFRHAFPLHAQKYPELCYMGKATRYWEHAHSDPLETLAELGVLGTLPMLLAGLIVASALLQKRFWRSPVACGVLIGAAALALHSCADLIFQSPALLFTWATLLLVAIRWLELDQARAGAGSAAPASTPGAGST